MYTPLTILGDVGEFRNPTSGNLDHENVEICAELAFQIVLAAKDNRGLKNQHAPKLNNN